MTNTKIEKLIVSYANKQKGVSYYDILAYAYDNDLTEWIDALKHINFRNKLSSLLRDNQIKDGIFQSELDSSFSRCKMAESQYSERQKKRTAM